MQEKKIDQFAAECNSLPGNMDYIYRGVAPSIEFSNTGRRGKKYFSITLRALIQTLIDIKSNLPQFAAHMQYEETTWRNLFSAHLSDNVVNALSTVQTLPLFSVIGKTIHIVNGLTGPYDDHFVELTQGNLNTAIAYLSFQLPDDSAYLHSQGKTFEAREEGCSVPVDGSNQDFIGENIIYYGAPGTGKSFEIDSYTDSANSTKTVFHPDTQYSDFVGCLKPFMNEGAIEYSFRPGPFCKALGMAHDNPEVMCYLVIEEINRAAAAAVFGEIFQLLDRSSDGSSIYSIDIADPDMLLFLADRAPRFVQIEKLSLPSNLSIVATMNSSDQAVMPLDTAFKRRWKFNYKPLDFSSCPEGSLKFFSENGATVVSWEDFAVVINRFLSAMDIPEDRLLGPWFLSSSELASDETSRSSLSGKLFIYLWDDVLRHGERSRIFSSEIATYGKLVDRFGNEESIFNDEVAEALSVVAQELVPEHDDTLIEEPSSDV